LVVEEKAKAGKLQEVPNNFLKNETADSSSLSHSILPRKLRPKKIFKYYPYYTIKVLLK
jgi:hypothetical protein